MSSSSTTKMKRNPETFNVDLEGNVYCYHDVVSVRRVAGVKSKRCGEEFYGCSHWPKRDCNFFLWKSDVDKMCMEISGQSGSAAIDALKIKNLELEKYILLDENAKLKNQISSSNMFRNVIVLICVIVIVFLIRMY